MELESNILILIPRTVSQASSGQKNENSLNFFQGNKDFKNKYTFALQIKTSIMS